MFYGDFQFYFELRFGCPIFSWIFGHSVLEVVIVYGAVEFNLQFSDVLGSIFEVDFALAVEELLELSCHFLL